MLPTSFRKFRRGVLIGFVSSLPFICSVADAQVPMSCGSLCVPPGTYVGVFGGYGRSTRTDVTQTGTAFFSAQAGGPLAVHASGHVDNTVGFVGAHVGYQWCGLSYCPGDGLENFAPAIEFEGYYLQTTQNGNLDNPTPRMPEHLFHDHFPTRAGVFLVNGLINYRILCTIMTPYVGLGIGTAVSSISGAHSLQEAPSEPGVNHFNSDTSSGNKWTFASQAKLGMRFDITNCLNLFVEYRFLYLTTTTYHFGPTVYPTHARTTGWDVKFKNVMINMGAIGLDYKF